MNIILKNARIMNLRYEKIRQKRKELGLSQENIAHEMGIDQSLYCKIENGEVTANLKKVQRIAELLSLEIEDIVDKNANYFHNNDHSVNNNIIEELHNHNDIEFFKKMFESYQLKSEELSQRYLEIISLKNLEIQNLKEKIDDKK